MGVGGRGWAGAGAGGQIGGVGGRGGGSSLMCDPSALTSPRWGHQQPSPPCPGPWLTLPFLRLPRHSPCQSLTPLALPLWLSLSPLFSHPDSPLLSLTLWLLLPWLSLALSLYPCFYLTPLALLIWHSNLYLSLSQTLPLPSPPFKQGPRE